MQQLVSRKVYKPPSSVVPWPLRAMLPSLKWLHPTVGLNGEVQPRYRHILRGLVETHRYAIQLGQFRSSLKAHDLDKSKQIWNEIRSVTGDAPIKYWPELMTEKQPFYGHSLLMNCLNDIIRKFKSDPNVLSELFCGDEHTLDPFLVPLIISRAPSNRIDICIDFFLSRGWSEETFTLGATALFGRVEMDPEQVLKVLAQTGNTLPQTYRLPSQLVHHLANSHYRGPNASQLFEAIAMYLNPRNPLVSKYLRRLYTNSDEGMQSVTKLLTKCQYPYQFYPFMVRVLCARYNSGDHSVVPHLDSLFDEVLVELSEKKPALVLEMLMQRVVTTHGVQNAGEILNHWSTKTDNRISEKAWLHLFQAFRFMGRPDKCAEVLKSALECQQEFEMPFIGEYLVCIARFCSLPVFIDALVKVQPQMVPLLAELGLNEYVEKSRMLASGTPLVALPTLTSKNCRFNHLHETMLNITYQAVLATVEDDDTALEFFHKYLAFMKQGTIKPSLRVCDQFVQFYALPPLKQGTPSHQNVRQRLDVAEYIFRQVIGELELKIPTDGKNHTKSLEVLCHQLAKIGEAQRAVRLMVDASINPHIVITQSVLDSWKHEVPKDALSQLRQWIRSR